MKKIIIIITGDYRLLPIKSIFSFFLVAKSYFEQQKKKEPRTSKYPLKTDFFPFACD